MNLRVLALYANMTLIEGDKHAVLIDKTLEPDAWR